MINFLVISPMVSTIIWGVILGAMLILEYRRKTSTFIWFAIGAMMSLLFSHYGTTSFSYQIMTFFVFSFGSIILIRQFVKKIIIILTYKINNKKLIGKNVIVTKDKNNKHVKGKYNGIVYTLAYDDKYDFKRGDIGVIESVEGFTLHIKKHGFFHC